MSFIRYFNNIDNFYSSENYNLAEDFLVPLLYLSKKYDRAVGFFSSTSLQETAKGLLNIYKKRGKIRLIMSPKLSEEDIKHIRLGYESREKIIEKSLLREYFDPETDIEKERLNLLSYLIMEGCLDIKIAVLKDRELNSISMYHEKIGICTDEEGNYVSFVGSLNESDNGLVNNFESLVAISSWKNKTTAESIKTSFEDIWSGKSKKLDVYSFPAALTKRIIQYKKDILDVDLLEKDFEQLKIKQQLRLDQLEIREMKPRITVELRDYQKTAIANWLNANAVGIFDMATGSGKTYTALAAIVSLLKRKGYRLPIVIVCPYKHLVQQWVDDFDKFNIINWVAGFSGSKYRGYRTQLKSEVLKYNLGITDYFVFITTTGSFRTKKTQEILSEINDKILLVADEAHNLGAPEVRELLDKKYKYRLALSATINRHMDEEGTRFLKNYFGDVCISYTLADAIKDGFLCRYNYIPIPVYMNENERAEYIDLSYQLAKYIITDQSGNTTLSNAGMKLAIKRARLVAGLRGKIDALKKEIQNHLDSYNMLIYCGTAVYQDSDGEEIRQVDEVIRQLGYYKGLKLGRYTSRESVKERENLKKRFESGNDLQALVAIKCLDEGVNIPSITKAFILASSTNPREYIQRRGRLLRLHRNKNVAFIYDFITLPIEFEKISSLTEEEKKYFKTLLNNELNRMYEFSSLAENSSIADELSEKIKRNYGFYTFDVNIFDEVLRGDDYE